MLINEIIWSDRVSIEHAVLWNEMNVHMNSTRSDFKETAKVCLPTPTKCSHLTHSYEQSHIFLFYSSSLSQFVLCQMQIVGIFSVSEYDAFHFYIRFKGHLKGIVLLHLNEENHLWYLTKYHNRGKSDAHKLLSSYSIKFLFWILDEIHSFLFLYQLLMKIFNWKKAEWELNH